VNLIWEGDQVTGALLGLVGLLVVGLPLMALAAGRWLPQPRDRRGPIDPALTVARAHGIGGIDVLRMQEAVVKGEQVTPGLRPATVAWAEHVLRQGSWPWSSLRGRRRRLVQAGFFGYPVLLLVWAVVQGLDGQVGLPLLYLVVLLLALPLGWRGVRRRDERARTAIVLNRAAAGAAEGS
jgi:hypothetical protein